MELLKDIYSVKDVAELLELTEGSIRVSIKKGKLKATKFNGAYIITKQDLDDFIAARGE